MAYTELNSDSYEIGQLEHGLNRTSLLRFSPVASLGDATALTARTKVRYTVDGTVWFAGRTLPAKRSIGPNGVEIIEYVAADITEWMARNPCDEVSRWYNRSQSDGNLFPYPTGKTVEEIIEAEFASIVGVGELIGSIDWSEAGTWKGVVPIDFETKGKTFLQLLDSMIAEIPTLAWWYDPTGSLTADDVTGGVLRFYDIASAPATIADVHLAPKTGAVAGTHFVEQLSIEEDISSSYDTLVFNGWGTFVERYEPAIAAFDVTDLEFGVPLRQSSDAIQQHNTATGGIWVNPDNNIYGSKGWHPGSKRVDAQWAYRRYQVTYPIADIRLRLDTSVVPNIVIREAQSMWAETVQWIYNTGPIVFTLGSVAYVGYLIGNVKLGVPYTGDALDDGGTQLYDYGTVNPNPDLYPSFPTDTEPRMSLGSPSEFEENYFVLSTALVHRADFKFSGNVSGDSAYDLLDGQPVFVYRSIGSHVWLRYTSKEDLQVTLTDGTLGYDKRIVLWDQRFLKYTDAESVVVRDDTSAMTDYANALFALLKRRRVYGSLSVVLPDSDVFGTFPMGCGIRINKWQNSSTYTLDAKVQSIVLTGTANDRTVRLGFDSPSTFTSIDKATKYRQWFTRNELAGTGGASGAGNPGAPGTGGGSTGEGGSPGGGGECGCGNGTGPTGTEGGGGGGPPPPPPPPPPPGCTPDCQLCIGSPPGSCDYTFTLGGLGSLCDYGNCTPPGSGPPTNGAACCATNADGWFLQGCCQGQQDNGPLHPPTMCYFECCYCYWQIGIAPGGGGGGS